MRLDKAISFLRDYQTKCDDGTLILVLEIAVRCMLKELCRQILEGDKDGETD